MLLPAQCTAAAIVSSKQHVLAIETSLKETLEERYA
jgi:hypothetical protein